MAALHCVIGVGLLGCATLERTTPETTSLTNASALVAQEERETSATQVSVWVGHGTLRLDQPQSPTLNWSLALVPEGSTITLRDPRAGTLWQYVLAADGSEVATPGKLGKDLLPYLPEGTDVKAFSFWLRGLRQGPQDLLKIGEDGFPQQLVSGNWTVDYTQWFPKDKYPLPQKLNVRHGDTQVEILIKDWAWAQDDTGPDAGTIEL